MTKSNIALIAGITSTIVLTIGVAVFTGRRVTKLVEKMQADMKATPESVPTTTPAV